MVTKSKVYENLAISLTSKLYRLCGKAIEIPLEKAGISLQEFKITGLLVGEEKVNQKTLASKLMVKPATLSVAIDKLERKGFIQRTISEKDKRVNYLRLCDEVNLSEMSSLLFNAESQILRGISQQDHDITVKTLKAMIQNLEEDLSNT
jgi:DNA-binding MarR family transcriptional regulator